MLPFKKPGVASPQTSPNMGAMPSMPSFAPPGGTGNTLMRAGVPNTSAQLGGLASQGMKSNGITAPPVPGMGANSMKTPPGMPIPAGSFGGAAPPPAGGGRRPPTGGFNMSQGLGGLPAAPPPKGPFVTPPEASENPNLPPHHPPTDTWTGGVHSDGTPTGMYPYDENSVWHPLQPSNPNTTNTPPGHSGGYRGRAPDNRGNASEAPVPFSSSTPVPDQYAAQAGQGARASGSQSGEAWSGGAYIPGDYLNPDFGGPNPNVAPTTGGPAAPPTGAVDDGPKTTPKVPPAPGGAGTTPTTGGPTGPYGEPTGVGGPGGLPTGSPAPTGSPGGVTGAGGGGGNPASGAPGSSGPGGSPSGSPSGAPTGSPWDTQPPPTGVPPGASGGGISDPYTGGDDGDTGIGPPGPGADDNQPGVVDDPWGTGGAGGPISGGPPNIGGLPTGNPTGLPTGGGGSPQNLGQQSSAHSEGGSQSENTSHGESQGTQSSQSTGTSTGTSTATGSSTGHSLSDAKQTIGLGEVHDLLGTGPAREANAANPYTRDQFAAQANRDNAAIDAAAQSQKEAILRKARASGMDENSPAIQQQLTQIDQQARGQTIENMNKQDAAFRQASGQFDQANVGQNINQRAQDLQRLGLDANVINALLGQTKSESTTQAQNQANSQNQSANQSTSQGQNTSLNDAYGWSKAYNFMNSTGAPVIGYGVPYY